MCVEVLCQSVPVFTFYNFSDGYEGFWSDVIGGVESSWFDFWMLESVNSFVTIFWNAVTRSCSMDELAFYCWHKHLWQEYLYVRTLWMVLRLWVTSLDVDLLFCWIISRALHVMHLVQTGCQFSPNRFLSLSQALWAFCPYFVVQLLCS